MAGVGAVATVGPVAAVACGVVATVLAVVVVMRGVVVDRAVAALVARVRIGGLDVLRVVLEVVWHVDVLPRPGGRSHYTPRGYRRQLVVPGAVRRLRIGRLRSRETVLHFEPDEHLAYDYVGTLPLRAYRADVTLTATDSGTTIHWHSEFTAKVSLTGWLLRRGLTRVLSTLSSQLAEAAAERRPTT